MMDPSQPLAKRPCNLCMTQKANPSQKSRSPSTGANDLDALNARARRKKIDPSRLIEATIEEKAKKRRIAEAPASSKWKPTG